MSAAGLIASKVAFARIYLENKESSLMRDFRTLYLIPYSSLKPAASAAWRFAS